MQEFVLAAPPAVRFEDVSVTLGDVAALDGATADVPRGGCTAVIGPNGAGKTTLIRALLGEVGHRGRIEVAPAEEGRAPRIGYVPQRLNFDRGMPLTVLEFLAMGLQRRPLFLGVASAARRRAMDLLDLVKAGHLADRGLGALSGGELQRALLGLALERDPDLLILDEPAAGVDVSGELILCEILEELRCRLGFTLLMVTHDLSTVTAHADHVICLNRKVLGQGPPRRLLTPELLAAAFGLHMGLADSRGLPDETSTCSAPCCRGGRHA